MSVITKKLGQFRQWTGEKFGSTEKSEATEDFKQLQMATETRKEGIENMHASLAAYSTTMDGKDPDKKMPTLSTGDKKVPSLTALGKAMVQQGRLQGEENSYGMALLRIGECETELSALQLELTSRIRQGFLFDISEILASVKEFTHLQKKLENRRLDYDAKQNKLTKSKKEKPALEEETRAAQYKYEETYKDLFNLMSRFGEREESLLGSLVEFAEVQAELFRQGHELTAKLVETLHQAGLEGVKRTGSFGLIKVPSFTDKLNGSSASLAKLNPTSEVKSITLPTSISNTRDEEKETASKPKVEKVLYRVRALYAFKGENEGDLSFAKGETVNVVGEVDENWLNGEVQDDDGTVRVGMFPSNYVEKLTNVPSEPAKSKGSDEASEVPQGMLNKTMSLGEEAMSQMKSALPGVGSLSDINAAITSVKLKASGSRKPSTHAASAEPVAEVAAVGACSTCGCDDFHPNAFKKGQCNMCFHKH